MKKYFINVAAFQYSAEAQIVKGRLDAEGIESFLVDNHTIDTDPLVSNAIGGVKLKVRKEDAEKSLEVLASIKKYAVDDEGLQISCPKCNGQKVQLFTNVKNVKSFFFFCISFFVNALPIFMKREYQCISCNYKFDLK